MSVIGEPIYLPALDPREYESWAAFAEVASVQPVGWTLVGGNLTQLHLLERGSARARSTQDIDVVIDVRARSRHVGALVHALRQVGYVLPAPNPAEKEHRWVRGEAQLDVLVPSFLGPRIMDRKHEGFGYLLATRGGQFALSRSERVQVDLAGELEFEVNRPDLIAALYGKCSALLNNGDPDRSRHYSDIGMLVGLLRDSELAEIGSLRRRQRRRLAWGLVMARESGAVHPVDLTRMHEVLDRLDLAGPAGGAL